MCKKKAVYTVPELAMRMNGMYNMYNAHCFGGILPRAVITFERGKGKAYGWTFSKKVWKQGKEYRYSIVIATEILNDLKQVLITLLHEMCHIYAMEKDIEDTSRHGYYHNNKFKEIAESAGLVCTKEKQGWATRSMTEELKQWIEDNCPISEIRLVQEEEQKEPKEQPEEESGEGESGADEEQKPKKKSGYYNYICPMCKAKVRATKANLLIGCFGSADKQHNPGVMEIES